MSFAKKLYKLPLLRTVRYALLNAVAWLSIVLARIVPRRFGLWLFGSIGSLVYLVPHADRARTITHLRRIFGSEWDEPTVKKKARGVYRELGKNMFDMFLLPRFSKEKFGRYVTHDPLDAVRNAYARGKGCIMVTAHTGCFQMQLHFIAFNGFEVFAIGKKLHDERLDALIRKTRSGKGIMYMDRSESPRKILRNLQEGKVFGVLIDQDTRVEGVFADFLGIPAFTPSGPVKMAMKYDIPLFVVTTARQEHDEHHVFIDGPIELVQGDDEDEDLVANVTTVNNYICRTIRKYPEQWVWMHRRWKKRPLLAAGERQNAV